ncbi:glycosyltransferase family 4 protein [bacterium]|nr:glycosyltransferase family 4 protein [bacterium]
MPKLLAISSEAILPPKSGGALRSTNLLVGLSRKLDVRVLLPQDQHSINKVLENSTHLTGPEWSGVHGHIAFNSLSKLERLRNYYWRKRENIVRRQWRFLPWQWFFGPHHSWKPLLRLMAKDYTPDYFLVEHTRNAKIFAYARKLWPNVICICDSHNVESELLRQVLPCSSETNENLSKVKRYEQQVLATSDILWACSADDLARYQSFAEIPKYSYIVPNGVATASVPFIQKPTNKHNILFVGHFDYEPNINGALWFYENVWPALKKMFPSLTWQLVGKRARLPILAMSDDDDINIEVDVPSIQPYLENATVAICPLHSGSGTRLKILEAFSAGIPVVSTSIGAEGLVAEPEIHFSIADSAEDFTKAVIYLLVNPSHRDNMRKQARALAEKRYDWDVISDMAIEDLLSIRIDDETE